MAKNPTHELVQVFNGEEEWAGAGSFREMRDLMNTKIEQADEDIAVTNDLAYYPMLRIQPFQGW
jgi:hypothetical protein